MLEFFSINTVFISLLDYDMSYIEFFGTVFYAWSVWLAVKNHSWTWPTSLVGVTFFAILFFQIQLYSDIVEQVFYFASALVGWWLWLHPRKKEENAKHELKITKSSPRLLKIIIISILVLSIILGYFMSNIHLYFSLLFIQPASFVYPDAITTIMSFAGQLLLTKKKLENWYLWIIVDVISIWLYFNKGMLLLSLVYVVFLILAIKGLKEWNKIYENENNSSEIEKK